MPNFNSPVLTVTKNKDQTVSLIYEFRGIKTESKIEKLDSIKNTINDYAAVLKQDQRIIVRSNISNIKTVFSRCNFDIQKIIFIANDNKVYL